MLKVLKTDNWKNIHPLFFYYQPLQIKLDEVVKHLLDMRKLGFLRAKYIIEDNGVL